MKKSIRSPEKIIKLPLIDGKVDDRVQENIDYLRRLKKEADERKAKTPAPAI